MSLDSSSAEHLLRKRKSLRRELSSRPDLHDIRVAVLAGSTANEVVDLTELLLLDAGFRPTFYISDYDRYYEEAVLAPERLVDFRPDVVYVHTSVQNVRGFPPLSATADDFGAAVDAELARFREIWTALHDRLGCQVIQNNFELPPTELLGNLDATSLGGRKRFVAALNLELAREAARNRQVIVQDLHGIAARVGLSSWFDWSRFYAYKIVTSADGSLAIARSLASLFRALYGKSKKCLVLDLDNTLWGGVIGDDGADRIRIGTETGEAEAYTAFQRYCLALRDRGVLLAVCSKNDDAVARSGFDHPDSILAIEHFAAFRANWSPKHENILAIAAELDLGIDSFVFVDDNPAERALVEAQLPRVAVPDVGADVALYIPILEAARYFEPVALSAEDLQRAEQYAAQRQRATAHARFADYGEYLDSLHMVAEIDAFRAEYLDRIAQLTNKTNQYNLTTRRHTLAEIEAMAADPDHITLYGKLTDAFGDNGLVSIVVGRRVDATLHLDLWLMSCRVLKRDLELAMLDAVVARARPLGVASLVGTYLPTAKNGMVADHYDKLGFGCQERGADGRSTWTLAIADYRPKNRHIAAKEPAR